MESPKDFRWKVGKIILRYVASTVDYGLWYTMFEDNNLIGYTDSDFAGNIDDWKSTSRYSFHLGTSLISWVYKKQPIITISSAQAKNVI